MSAGFRTIRHATVDSTNERAFAALAAGEARHGDVHVARAQSAGRGRRGARWESPEDRGVYASAVLLPAAPAPAAVLVTMAAGLAVLDAVHATGLAGARLKWPNDVFVGDAKLAGVLVETRGLDPGAPHFVVGAGINVTQREFPPALARERALTSLELAGSQATPEDVLTRLLVTLEARWEQALTRPRELAHAYLEATGLAGAQVRVTSAEDVSEGRLLELDPERGLVLVDERGSPLHLALEHVRGVERAAPPPLAGPAAHG